MLKSFYSEILFDFLFNELFLFEKSKIEEVCEKWKKRLFYVCSGYRYVDENWSSEVLFGYFYVFKRFLEWYLGD